MRSGRIETNPVGTTFWPTEENPRERVLSDKELALIWRCTSGSADRDRIVRLLLLTGARREEIAGTMWSELTLHDDGSAIWLLPASRAKNKRALELASRSANYRRSGRARTCIRRRRRSFFRLVAVQRTA
jgi:integrase